MVVSTGIQDRLSLRESARTRETSRSIVTHNNHIHFAEPTISVVERPKRLLAIGGSKHFEMLEYHIDRATILVAGPVNFRSFQEADMFTPLSELRTEVYRVEKLGFNRYTKLVYVHDSLTNEQAIEELKEGLLRMFITQPYA